MLITNQKGLYNHLKSDFEIEENAVLWLHVGIQGLAYFKDGLDGIMNALKLLVPNGCLLLPAFSYSWCNNLIFDINNSDCNECGNFAEYFRKQKNVKRNFNPNFSISILDNSKSKTFEKKLINESDYKTCFGKHSVFDIIIKNSFKIPSYIILLGGAHDDVLFRSTFFHYVEEEISVPYRYKKKFFNPINKYDYTEQYVKYNSLKEYLERNNNINKYKYKFPIKEKYETVGKDLLSNSILQIKKFAYSNTRIVKINDLYTLLNEKIKHNSEYLLK